MSFGFFDSPVMLYETPAAQRQTQIDNMTNQRGAADLKVHHKQIHHLHYYNAGIKSPSRRF